MDIVYASLKRRWPGDAAEAIGAAEAAAAVDALWAHAEPADGLQHASAQPADDRIDFLLYLLSRDSSDSSGSSGLSDSSGSPGSPGSSGRPDRVDAVCRAHSLIARSHRTSPMLLRCYLPPEPPEATDCTDR
ncbi:hypothetical protein [Streptomyces sp. 1331.2]|uniref:hypothetical protein n=1 Tax=Streptomyces sp. 1331.2 TaxID=1938835 RepID=UPI000BDDDECE|nr:hypothetical protein [Streptomyces sp. 1331.2]SOB78771.1 hypothetical protein SAMN06272789_0078 [Streptomyces sp. 1331.2]